MNEIQGGPKIGQLATIWVMKSSVYCCS